MTQRERQILNWIEADPMISQQELAERLHVTNKAVSKWETGGSLR